MNVNKDSLKSLSIKQNIKSVRFSRVLRRVILLILFLAFTNPAMIPFLPQETKDSLQKTWGTIFGDIDSVTKSFHFSWSIVFQVITIILIMLIISSVTMFIIDHTKPSTPKGLSISTMLRSAIRYLCVLVGFFWVLSAIGVNLSTIFASVGIVALIIGFGAQSLVEDMVTGVFLIVEDQFNVGDIIEVGGFRGQVMSIGIRTTTLKDTGDNLKIINNSDLRNVINRSSSYSYAVTTVGISYNADLEQVEKVIARMLPAIRAKYPSVFVQDPTYLGVQELADSSVDLKFAALVKESDIFNAPRLMNREIKLTFDREGIEIPFNQLVVTQAKN